MHSATPSPKLDRTSADGTLLGLLTAGFYALFTLLPGSNTLMVSWPWAFLWQVSLALPILWLLWQVGFKPLRQLALGSGLDWVAALMVVGLIVSTLAADFPQQARWYTWVALGGLAALYALNGWLNSPRRLLSLLQFQGGLALAFIALSLGLWISQIYLPELARLNTLRQYGVDLAFSFQFTSLRNWQPIGHQNYVAGYLVLVLPLLAALAWVSKGWQRWLWLAGTGLGLVNLYTTSSRGGWLALMGLAVGGFAIALLLSPLPRRVLWSIGAVGLGGMLIAIATNDRLSGVIRALLRGDVGGGELVYRLITNAVGWNMGIDRPLTGQGLGSAPLVYQQYRPYWAGREAELQYQLHSTPAQLWGELGIWGILVPIALVGVLSFQTFRWVRRSPATDQTLPPVLVWSLLGGLLAYGILSLTDYQVDNLCIAGAMLIYLAVLARTWQPQLSTQAASPGRINRWLVGLGLGTTLAMTLWLVPIHRAWSLSSDGFVALQRGDLDSFVRRLEQAHTLAPWEPYYAHQLGWNLGNLSYQSPDPGQSQALRRAGIEWFQRANAVAPYLEFGHSNLGWLLIGENQPQEATAAFAESSRLIPAKPGVFFGLGFSRLLAGNTDQAVEAMALEIVRNPMLISSSVWQVGQFAALAGPVLDRVETITTDLIADAPAGALKGYLHQVRGGTRWWQGDLAQANEDWQIGGSAASLALLALAQNQPVDLESLPPGSPEQLALQAWFTPAERRDLLAQAWVAQPEDLPQLDEVLPPEDILNELETTMNQSPSLEVWLKQNAPSWQPRSQRLGFGIISRHIDGPQPSDYLPRIENVPMVKFFDTVFPEAIYLPELDSALQPYRDELLNQVSSPG
ncbi:O-antigen ligase family protein [Pseudanabaena sp. FACHB-2040]|uniref:O-antigen ligase family protein n=1 Tax=Pseudanabaena sp. FACHB-2040 TaxID=2692859 RepID=UPI001681F05C|nr:O-antigen ligase family protein [Pseudanabaena sp. FACHB-2040]MBD2260800.1 O-antigen ligase family protein [Pseudanabaena sp. FACHB-2040]